MKSVYKKDGTLINLLQDVDIEAGTSYIKFPNGIAIVFMKKDFEGSFVALGGEYRLMLNNPFIFPIKFIEIPTITVSTANTIDYAYCSAVGVVRDNTSINILALGRPTEIKNTTVGVQVIAIGRWK